MEAMRWQGDEARGSTQGTILIASCYVLGTVMGTQHLPTDQANGELKTPRADF